MTFRLAMSTDTQQLHAIVRGQVQGVNFRSSTQAQARRLGLLGWVRNRPEGTVEVVAEGSRSALEQLLGFLHTGPATAVVNDVQPTWLPAMHTHKQYEVRW